MGEAEGLVVAGDDSEGRFCFVRVGVYETVGAEVERRRAG